MKSISNVKMYCAIAMLSLGMQSIYATDGNALLADMQRESRLIDIQLEIPYVQQRLQRTSAQDDVQVAARVRRIDNAITCCGGLLMGTVFAILLYLHIQHITI